MNYPPAQNQYMQEKILGEFIFARGLYSLLREYRKIFLRDHFRILAKFLREFISVRIDVALVFASARIQEDISGELFMCWFRARGYFLDNPCPLITGVQLHPVNFEGLKADKKSGKLFYLQLELFCLQLSFFAYSPLRPLLGALSHCEQKSSNCK